MKTVKTQFLLHRWRAEAGGSIVLWLAAALPLLLTIAGAGSDFATYVKLKTEMQAAADAAALAAAHEIPLAKSNPESMINAAKSYAKQHLGQAPAGSGSKSVLSTGSQSADSAGSGSTGPAREHDGYDVGVNFDSAQSEVKVSISADWTPMFAAFLGNASGRIDVVASARFFGAANVCVLGLSPATVGGVRLWNASRLTGKNCAVFSNTNAPDGIAVMDAASLTAEHICVVGGYDTGSAKSVTPQPITDCPPLPDPLAARVPPAVGSCDYTSFKITTGSKTLSPGVYCGGINIGGDAKVTLDPGIYVVKDGPLLVTKTAWLQGKGAGFYLTGLLSSVFFDFDTTIDLAAPVDGALAGLLFFENRAAKGIRIHRIASNNARNLLGTIYLPVSILNIDSSAPVADQSAYTAIVTKSLQLQSGPDLVLNTNYELTDVPVPEGIKGSARVVLTE